MAVIVLFLLPCIDSVGIGASIQDYVFSNIIINC